MGFAGGMSTIDGETHYVSMFPARMTFYFVFYQFITFTMLFLNCIIASEYYTYD